MAFRSGRGGPGGSGANGSGSRYRIEPFRHRVDLPADYKEKTWEKLATAIACIFDNNPSKLSFEELYRCAYNMVLHKFGHFLYENVSSTVARHVETVGRRVETKSGEAFLQELVHAWSEYKRAMQNIRDILMYMNKTFVKQHSRTPVHELGLQLWHEHLLRRPLVAKMTREVVLAAVLKFREGKPESKEGNPLVAQVTKMAMEIGPAVYAALVERPVQEDAKRFYRRVSQESLVEGQHTMDCRRYLELVQRSLGEEGEMVDAFLFESSKPKMIQSVEQEMIGRAQVDILIQMKGSGLLFQLSARDFAALGLMYRTLARSPEGCGHAAMVDLLQAHLKDTGAKIMRQECKAAAETLQLVRQLIQERLLCDELLEKSFESDRRFANAVQSCFEHVLNSHQGTPEFLSLYLDAMLRKDLRAKSDEEVEQEIDRAMTLFRYLNDKDVFEKYYKQQLAKRLLSLGGSRGGGGAKEEHEKMVILKLKTECGYQFTSKLESMFNDIRTSQDTMASFKEQDEGATGGVEVGVQVLTTGSWPTQPPEAAGVWQIPKALQGCCERFEAFYLKTHSGRKLTWQTNMGHGEVRAVFGGGEGSAQRRHELSVSTVQICVLMLFNERATWRYEDIRRAVLLEEGWGGAAEGELRRCLQSLACVKGKNVLCKTPVGREVEDGDAFAWNDQFKSNRVKVKIGTISAGSGSASGVVVRKEEVEEDRKPQVEAAIVRVMKSRRVLSHSEVVAEVAALVKGKKGGVGGGGFLPSPAMIKQRIESLIEREFLERDEGDRRVLRYVS